MSSDLRAATVVVDGATIDHVVEPETVDELRETLRRVNSDDQRAVICGGQSRLAYGNLGGPFDLAISTARLNRVIHYEPDDLTLAVEPGCTLRQLDELLATHGQQLALDVAHDERATIGGSYATGLSGPRRLGGGSLKDWVVGVEVAGPDGSLAKAGGMVVKNVTGFDMMHAHYGALGALGIVTRLNLKVFPRPGAVRSLSMRLRTSAEAHAAGVALLGSQLQPSSIVVTNADGWRLDVRIEAPPGAIDRVVARTFDAASAGAPFLDASDSVDPRAALAPFTRVADLLVHPAVARLAVPASRQATAIANLDATGNRGICADLGSGLIYVAGQPTVAWLTATQSVSERPTFLKLPPDEKRDRDVFGALDARAVDIVGRLKAAFDPAGRLNHGRWVAGL